MITCLTVPLGEAAPVLPAPGQSAYGLIVLALCTLILFAVILGRRILDSGQRSRQFAADPLAPHCPVDRPAFAPLCGTLGLFLVLGVCYFLCTGLAVQGVGARSVTFLVMLVCWVGGGGLLWTLQRQWDPLVAGAGAGLICLALCCVAALFLPGRPAALAGRFPLVFNAILIGLACGAWLWNWLSCVWDQQLDNGVAWTAAGRLIGPARRTGFFAVVLALAVAVLMSVWPRLSVATDMDDSLGRITAGVGGHLLLLWVVLWSGRRLGDVSYAALAVLSLASMIAFIYIRTEPLITAAF